jgi:hypothetical protein
MKGRCFLICWQAGIVFSAHSLCELVASVIARVCRRVAIFVYNGERIHHV